MFEFVVTCHELYLRPSVLGCVDSNRNLRRDVTVGWTHLGAQSMFFTLDLLLE